MQIEPTATPDAQCAACRAWASQAPKGASLPRAKREERERRHGGRDAEEREMLAAPPSKERSGKKKRERRRDPTGYDI